MMRLRSAMKVHGGKSYVVPFLLEHQPANHTTYVEVYGGAGNLLLNKTPTEVEILNDLDNKISNIFSYLKNHSQEFIEKLRNVPYTEEIFKEALVGTKTGLDGAINEVIVRRMSRGGLGKTFAWSERLRGGIPGDVNAWMTFKRDHLPRICERLKNVTILNENAIDVIANYDSENVFMYLDPPYYHKVRTVPNVYAFEMTEADHILLAEVLKDVKSKVMLSGYYSQLYAKLYKGWNMATKDVANHSSQSKVKQRRVECVWMNY